MGKHSGHSGKVPTSVSSRIKHMISLKTAGKQAKPEAPPKKRHK